MQSLDRGERRAGPRCRRSARGYRPRWTSRSGYPAGGGLSGGTTPVGAEVAEAEPYTFVALTTTSSVKPASPGAITYVCAVAPGIGTQFAPAASQRCHW